ncbi:MerR family transcriptional regulator [Phycicoccus sp. 3266]|uniref:MerR family transcriptional regulator n=1 Tax=Phycicoccus sp. 3266 TaxID=2817751 RepID=UPI0028633AC9|nr:MerR family transcriptional regulator [Phycicoccus sp. 3266]MDR6864097.1 DNA-binding transcriptional MerR regulator/methylmalonyl-CoA mutase cobalamin-binding subunit [Phycicoccus sp. 3266]
MHTIGHTASLTGVPVATLRAWERRYAVVSPTRTAAGYRLYDDLAVRTLTAMAALVAAGWAPRDAAAHLAAGEAETRPADTEGGRARGASAAAGGAPDESGQAADRPGPAVAIAGADTTVLSRAAAALDPRLAESALEEAFAVAGPEQAVDGWLLPALRVLGEDWRAGRVDVAGEHLVTAAVQRRLGAALDAAGPQLGNPKVAVGLPRGARHELGVTAFTLLLRRSGLQVAYLGPDVPPESWAVVLRHHAPAAVVLGVPSADDVAAAREAAAVLGAADPRPTVYVGGSAQAAVGAGTVPLGHHVRSAVARLVRELRAQGVA